MPKKIFTQELEETRPRKGSKEEVEWDLQVPGVRRWTWWHGKVKGDCSSGQIPQWAVVPMEEEEGRNCRVVRLLLKYGEIKTPGNCWLGTSLRYLIRITTFVSLVWRFEAIWTSNGCVDQQRDSVAGPLWTMGAWRHVREDFINTAVITWSQAEQILYLCLHNGTNLSAVHPECYCLPYMSLYNIHAPCRFCGGTIKIVVVRASVRPPICTRLQLENS
jgi:hypothetical protein